jgi:twitching motility protein PilI
MATIQSAAEVISLLQDIELRSKQKAAGLDQSEGLQTWTAIGFRVEEHRFLVPLAESKEVFPVPTGISSVPKASNWVFGITNLRGELLPLIDLKQFLLHKKTELDKRSRIMVINHPEIYTGVLVDEVYGLKHFQRDPSTLDSNKNVQIIPYLNGSVFQQDIAWDVFSFHKLADDLLFMNTAV